MIRQITKEELTDNSFFWYAYICWFRGYDDKNELNIDEVLEVIDIDREELYKWEQEFFPENESEEAIRFVRGEIDESISFHFEFQKYEVVFFINDLYIGNLGGHFEAWFLTWEELLALKTDSYLFLLLLPMTGVEVHQFAAALELITNQLKTIPKFEDKAGYIADCILNGLKTSGPFFKQEGVGIVNKENHSVRNIEKYPRYTEDVIKLNDILKTIVDK
ncbi:Imm19 family immunity protein [Terrimonas rubra]|uniref:Imm19 family immunity protein n=1 Tax=Terrimonas rubra TaxID=1035890 RepID=A0ABW6A7C2_9BACT